MFRFEKLDAWRESIEFTHEIHEATCRFPQQEQFGLVSQLRRAAVSISSNIAEKIARILSGLKSKLKPPPSTLDPRPSPLP